MSAAPPLPAVGDRIRKFVSPGNPNNWMRFGVVRAVVDRHLVVKRWLPKKRRHVWLIIEDIDWEYGHARYQVRKARQ